MPTSSRLWKTPSQIEQACRRVEVGLREAVTCADPFVSGVTSHLVNHGGKRLRSVLVLLSSCFGSGPSAAIIDVAIAVELLHTATLYHDDIVDQATLRRNAPSANTKWGKLAATFAGDYIFAKSTELFSAAGNDVNEAVTNAIAELWEGQMKEKENVYNSNITLSDYFEIIEKKTATLYKLPCYLGALLGGAPSHSVEKLSLYGRNLGIAFQVLDDVKDILLSEAALDKTPGADIREGVYTLPVIYALNSGGSASERLSQILGSGALMTPDNVLEAIGLLRGDRSAHNAVRTSARFLQLAADQLVDLPPTPVKDCLADLLTIISDPLPAELRNVA